MSTFRPVIGLPEWTNLRNDISVLVISDPYHTDNESVWLNIHEAEALLAVLLDICPNAQNAVDDWLARERLMIVERGGREP